MSKLGRSLLDSIYLYNGWGKYLLPCFYVSLNDWTGTNRPIIHRQTEKEWLTEKEKYKIFLHHIKIKFRKLLFMIKNKHKDKSYRTREETHNVS